MSQSDTSWHSRVVETKSGVMAALTTVAILIGGIVEIIPMYSVPEINNKEAIPPYTPLELAGRDIYIREGCYNCHSQMVRPMRAETMRYGEWSHAYEYSHDRPFQLGSRRIGPDLHRVGGKYPDAWHFEHMRDPRVTSPGSLMPPYTWLLEDKIDTADVTASVQAMKTLGEPYSDQDLANVAQSLSTQGSAIVANLAQAGITTTPDSEIVALISYLQTLGKYKPAPATK